jgi:polyisoprenoid-binding protein YceI
VRTRPIRLLVTVAVLLAACAAIAPGRLGAAVGPTLLPTGTFAIVPGESSVAFVVPDNRGGFMGHTTRVTGQVTVERPAGATQVGAEVYTADVTATIAAGTITTDNAARDAAMRAVYLRTGAFPAITFTGTVKARPGLGVRPFAATARGQLTIRDVTREQAFSATVVALANEYLADASTLVRMADYGIPYPRAFIFVAHDPVTVRLHIVARRQ